jgi:hypothetical protein
MLTAIGHFFYGLFVGIVLFFAEMKQRCKGK